MKNLILILMLLITITSINIFAQDVPTPPKPERDFHFPMVEMTEESEKQYLKAVDAQTKAELEQIKQYDKQKYSELLMEAYFNSHSRPFFRMDPEEKEIIERQKTIAKLGISVEALKLKYKHAESSEKNKIKSDLNKTLFTLFDLKEADKKFKIAMLQEELEQLKKSINVRAKNRDKIVERRLQDLIGEGDFLEWD